MAKKNIPGVTINEKDYGFDKIIENGGGSYNVEIDYKVKFYLSGYNQFENAIDAVRWLQSHNELNIDVGNGKKLTSYFANAEDSVKNLGRAYQDFKKMLVAGVKGDALKNATMDVMGWMQDVEYHGISYELDAYKPIFDQYGLVEDGRVAPAYYDFLNGDEITKKLSEQLDVFHDNIKGLHKGVGDILTEAWDEYGDYKYESELDVIKDAFGISADEIAKSYPINQPELELKKKKSSSKKKKPKESTRRNQTLSYEEAAGNAKNLMQDGARRITEANENFGAEVSKTAIKDFLNGYYRSMEFNTQIPQEYHELLKQIPEIASKAQLGDIDFDDYQRRAKKYLDKTRKQVLNEDEVLRLEMERRDAEQEKKKEAAKQEKKNAKQRAKDEEKAQKEAEAADERRLARQQAEESLIEKYNDGGNRHMISTTESLDSENKSFTFRDREGRTTTVNARWNDTDGDWDVRGDTKTNYAQLAKDGARLAKERADLQRQISEIEGTSKASSNKQLDDMRRRLHEVDGEFQQVKLSADAFNGEVSEVNNDPDSPWYSKYTKTQFDKDLESQLRFREFASNEAMRVTGASKEFSKALKGDVQSSAMRDIADNWNNVVKDFLSTDKSDTDMAEFTQAFSSVESVIDSFMQQQIAKLRKVSNDVESTDSTKSAANAKIDEITKNANVLKTAVARGYVVPSEIQSYFVGHNQSIDEIVKAPKFSSLVNDAVKYSKEAQSLSKQIGELRSTSSGDNSDEISKLETQLISVADRFDDCRRAAAEFDQATGNISFDKFDSALKSIYPDSQDSSFSMAGYISGASKEVANILKQFASGIYDDNTTQKVFDNWNKRIKRYNDVVPDSDEYDSIRGEASRAEYEKAKERISKAFSSFVDKQVARLTKVLESEDVTADVKNRTRETIKQMRSDSLDIMSGNISGKGISDWFVNNRTNVNDIVGSTGFGKNVKDGVKYLKQINKLRREIGEIQGTTGGINDPQIEHLSAQLSELESRYESCRDAAKSFDQTLGDFSSAEYDKAVADMMKMEGLTASNAGYALSGATKEVGRFFSTAEASSFTSEYGRSILGNFSQVVNRFNNQGPMTLGDQSIYAEAQKNLQTYYTYMMRNQREQLEKIIRNENGTSRSKAMAKKLIDQIDKDISEVPEQMLRNQLSPEALEKKFGDARTGSMKAKSIEESASGKTLSANISNFLANNTSMDNKTRNQFVGLREMVNSFQDMSKLDLQGFENQFQNIRDMAISKGFSGKSFWTTFTERIKNSSAQFLATYFSLQDVIRYAREAAQAIIEVDTAMVELRKVSNASDFELANSLKISEETAKDLGATVSDVVNATADWSRLGYDLPEAEELGRVATLYKNVGDGISIDDANSSLISVLQGFQLNAGDAESIVDKINEVANNFPIDSGGIGEALQRSAASFNAAHTDLSKSIALVTTTNSVVQDPDVVGTMWKTVSARLRGAKTELEDMGEDTDGMVTSTSKLRDLVKGITGFDIMESETEFKDIYDIVMGIGEQWDNINDIDKAEFCLCA